MVKLASEFLNVPSHGFLARVAAVSLPWRAAEEQVVVANQEREQRRGLPPSGEASPMEIALAAAFIYYGMAPALQQPIGPFDADFCFLDARLVVETDGKQWHDAKRDETRDAIMARESWMVMRFTGRSVYRDPLQCAREVRARLAEIADGGV
jgi:very-short-patch-repair endonuclease